jgi:hypothetical protein
VRPLYWKGEYSDRSNIAIAGAFSFYRKERSQSILL